MEIHIDSATATGIVITIKNGTEPQVNASLSANPVTPTANEEVEFQTQLTCVVTFIIASRGNSTALNQSRSW